MELGADRCIPCKKMQPIMRTSAAAFPDRVQVIFYDVWEDRAVPRRCTPAIHDASSDIKGKEIARHVGLKEEILELLKKHGVQ